jgi:Arc/MetJ-type ribon-helix-helix transcriptional regulator
MLESGERAMSVTVKVSEETAEIVQRKVDQGLYPDVETAWAEAARLHDEYADEQELRAALQIGIDEADRGEVLEWTPELNRRLLEEARELYRRGVKPDEDA